MNDNMFINERDFIDRIYNYTGLTENELTVITDELFNFIYQKSFVNGIYSLTNLNFDFKNIIIVLPKRSHYYVTIKNNKNFFVPNVKNILILHPIIYVNDGYFGRKDNFDKLFKEIKQMVFEFSIGERE